MRAAGEAAAGARRDGATVRLPAASPSTALPGARWCMATTTPYDLVKPLADWLGFDDVLATRYGVDADGTFDGTIAGPFVWAPGKLAPFGEWAASRASTSRESYAYSDSVFDSPLLSAVGHPVVVNPDPAWS